MEDLIKRSGLCGGTGFQDRNFFIRDGHGCVQSFRWRVSAEEQRTQRKKKSGARLNQSGETKKEKVLCTSAVVFVAISQCMAGGVLPSGDISKGIKKHEGRITKTWRHDSLRIYCSPLHFPDLWPCRRDVPASSLFSSISDFLLSLPVPIQFSSPKQPEPLPNRTVLFHKASVLFQVCVALSVSRSLSPMFWALRRNGHQE